MPDGQQAAQPSQHQSQQPGLTAPMDPAPQDHMQARPGSGKLARSTALITGGDRGIGRAVAIGFAKEGADVALLYLDEHDDAAETEPAISADGRRCKAIAGDIGDAAFVRDAGGRAAQALGGRIDVLVNNAAEQHECRDFAAIPEQQVERNLRTNILRMMWVTKAAPPHLPDGGAIISTTSITAFQGSPTLIDYASTEGAILGFTRSLAEALYQQRRIRVNAVAPGPIWTSLIPASFQPERTSRP